MIVSPLPEHMLAGVSFSSRGASPSSVTTAGAGWGRERALEKVQGWTLTLKLGEGTGTLC